METNELVEITQKIGKISEREKQIEYLVDNLPVKKIADALLTSIENIKPVEEKPTITKVTIDEIQYQTIMDLFDNILTVVPPVNKCGRPTAYSHLSYEEQVEYINNLHLPRGMKYSKLNRIYHLEKMRRMEAGEDVSNFVMPPVVITPTKNPVGRPRKTLSSPFDVD